MSCLLDYKVTKMLDTYQRLLPMTLYIPYCNLDYPDTHELKHWISKLLQKDGGAQLDWSTLTNTMTRWMQKSDILESMLPTGGFHKEAILF